MKKFLSTLCVIGVVAICILCLIGCPSIPIPPYNANGVLDTTQVGPSFSSESPSKVGVYVETSGSMNGLFRNNYSTGFKTDVPYVLTASAIKSKIVGVNIFNNEGDGILHQYQPSEFITKMMSGEFISQRSTYIPKMVETMLKDIDSCVCDVAVLISDMKYSPVNSKGVVTPVVIAAFRREIKSLFETRFESSDLSVSLICCESNFLDRSGNELCADFPYYFVVVGKMAKVAWVRNQIINNLNSNNRVKGCVDFNIDYGCPKYTVLPNSILGAVRNPQELAAGFSGKHCSSILGFNDNMQPVKVELGVNYNHLPEMLLNALTPSDFVVDYHYGGMEAKVVSVERNHNRNASTELNYTGANLLITLELHGLSAYDDEVVKITLNTKSQNSEWLEKYYGAQRESDLSKTFLLEEFVGGLNDAATKNFGTAGAKLMSNLQNSSMHMFVSRDNYKNN